MALLSLSIKHPSEFLEVPPSPPQSPPVVDAEFSPPSPTASSADSPIGGDGEFLRLPLSVSSASLHGGAERAKKRRKQERPSLIVVDQNCTAVDDDDPVTESKRVELADDCVPLALNAVSGAEQWSPLRGTHCESKDQDIRMPDPEGIVNPEGLSTSELHPSTAVVKPVQATISSPVQSSTPMSSTFQRHQTPPTLYPSSPALARVASCGGGSDGEGDGSDGGGSGAPETCPECRKVFKRRVYLQRHMAREHWSTAKVFKCDKCAYETKHQSNLLVHRRTHTGERPYHCGACGQRYTQGHLLKAHIRSRHGAEMAYYNMDKRSDGVRCRRSLSSASRLDPTSTAATGLINPALKEDKIRFLLEAAEAARGAGSTAQRPAVPAPPPTAPFAGMSLGQYMNALSSCLPGTAGIRPLLWTPTQPFQPLPHDGVASHAALLSSLAAAPMPSVQDPISTPAQGVPDRSILNSLLASYATGSPLFSINGLSSSATGVTGIGSTDVVGSSPLRCPSTDVPVVPQDLSMSGAKDGRGCGDTASEYSTNTSFLSSTTACSMANSLRTGHQLNEIPSSGCAAWPDGACTFGAVKREDEVATDLSVRGADTYEKIRQNKSAAVVDGTVDLSARIGDRKPRKSTSVVDRDPADLVEDSLLVGKSICCDNNTFCPHLQKLKELRRNVYRMLSVFTPYLDVAGAGIADVEADAVDDFLHEVIYSSKLDQATD